MDSTCAPGLRTGLIEPPWVRGEIPGASSGLGFPCRQMGRCLAAFSQTGQEPPGQSRRTPCPSAENPQGCFDSAGPHPQISLGFCETMWWNESKHPEGSAGEGGMEPASRSPPPEQLPPRLYQRRPICLPGAVQGGEEGLEADPLITRDTAHSPGQG